MRSATARPLVAILKFAHAVLVEIHEWCPRFPDIGVESPDVWPALRYPETPSTGRTTIVQLNF